MPTGYTAPIAEGIKFDKFVMLCARAFSACIEMRDEAMDAPIPDEFKPSDYHHNRIKEYELRLSKVRGMTYAECAVAASKEYDETKRGYQESQRKASELKSKYVSMLDKVDAWSPPSADHNGLKKFMREQIEESMKYDCGDSYYEGLIRDLKMQTGREWKASQIADCKKQLECHSEEHKKEIDRCNSRSLWVKQLRESLNAHSIAR